MIYLNVKFIRIQIKSYKMGPWGPRGEPMGSQGGDPWDPMVVDPWDPMGETHGIPGWALGDPWKPRPLGTHWPLGNHWPLGTWALGTLALGARAHGPRDKVL